MQKFNESQTQFISKDKKQLLVDFEDVMTKAKQVMNYLESMSQRAKYEKFGLTVKDIKIINFNIQLTIVATNKTEDSIKDVILTDDGYKQMVKGIVVVYNDQTLDITI